MLSSLPGEIPRKVKQTIRKDSLVDSLDFAARIMTNIPHWLSEYNDLFCLQFGRLYISLKDEAGHDNNDAGVFSAFGAERILCWKQYNMRRFTSYANYDAATEEEINGSHSLVLYYLSMP